MAYYRCNRICRRLLRIRGRGDFCLGVLLSGGLLPEGTWPGGFLSGGAFVRGSFARGSFARGTFVQGLVRSPQVQCVYAPSRLSVPSIVAWRTNKKTKRQTRPRSSAGSRPPLPKFSGYVEVEAHYIYHPSTIWVRPLFTELGRKKPQKADFAMKQTNIIIKRQMSCRNSQMPLHLCSCLPIWNWSRFIW